MGAPIFLDGFDHYSTAQLPQKWAVPGFATISAPGRFGVGQFMVGDVSFTGALQTPAVALMGAGLAYKTQRLGQQNVFCFDEAGISRRLAMGHTADGRVLIAHPTYPGEAVSARSTNTFLRENVWNYIEMFYVSGSVGVYVNGELAVSGSIPFIDYGSGPEPPRVDSVELLGPGGGFFASFDDMYVRDDTIQMGDVQVRSNMPDGDGAALQWIPSTGITHFNLVNSIPVDITKSVSTGVTARDSYTYGDIASDRSIIALQFIPWSEGRSVIAEARIAGFFFNLGNTASMAAGIGFSNKIVTTDPSTGLPWVVADFNSDQFGIAEIV